MSIVDWVLIGAVVIFAWAGWRQGFVAGVLSFTGFLGGGLLSAFWLPGVIERNVESTVLRGVLVGVGVLASALAGQFLTSMLGRALRDKLTWKPVRFADNVAGSALNVLALAVVVWIIASALAYLPETSVSRQVQQSRVLVTLDRAVPDPARNAFGDLRDLVGTTAMPRVFSGFAEFIGPDVDEPNLALLDAPGVQKVRDSVLRIVGDANDCDTTVNGSGFAYAPSYVLTNAHVVAGVRRPAVQQRLQDPPLPARVVHFDPELDIAVLYVPDLQATPVTFAATTANSGDDALAAGFPGTSGFRVSPVRIRTIVQARGDDIYGKPGVVREVYAFRGEVRPGNSGGPLLDAQGAVLGMVFAAGRSDSATGFALTNAQVEGSAAVALGRMERVSTGSCNVRN
jgi:S1-C subfamily serine protease